MCVCVSGGGGGGGVGGGGCENAPVPLRNMFLPLSQKFSELFKIYFSVKRDRVVFKHEN